MTRSESPEWHILGQTDLGLGVPVRGAPQSSPRPGVEAGQEGGHLGPTAAGLGLFG